MDLMPQDMRDEISGVLLAAFTEVKNMLIVSGGTPPASGSAADLLLAQQYSLSFSSAPKFRVAVAIHYAALSGVEHAAALAHSLQRADSTFHLATLARGCLEAYARSWWLMSATTPGETVARWLSTVAKEMSVKLRIDPNLEYWSGSTGTTRVDGELSKVVADLSTLTPDGKPVPFDYTRVATDFGSKFHSSPRAKYSELSGVAHGDPIALGQFFGEASEKTSFLLALPRESGLLLAEQVFHATAAYVSEIRAWTGLSRTSTDPWAVNLDAARSTLLRAREGLEDAT